MGRWLDDIRRFIADIGSGVAENHLMDDIILPKFRSAVAESFVQTDLGYGDGIASRRLKDALRRYFAEYVYSIINASRSCGVVVAGDDIAGKWEADWVHWQCCLLWTARPTARGKSLLVLSGWRGYGDRADSCQLETGRF